MDCVPRATPPAAAPDLPLQDLRAIVLPPIEPLSVTVRHLNSLGSQTRREISADSIPLPRGGRDGLPRDRRRDQPRAAGSSLSIEAIAGLHSLAILPPVTRHRADRSRQRPADSTWSAGRSPRTTSSNSGDLERFRTGEPVQ